MRNRNDCHKTKRRTIPNSEPNVRLLRNVKVLINKINNSNWIISKKTSKEESIEINQERS
jgi:hypothetical protein